MIYLTKLFILALIICGGVYITYYEDAPLSHRLQVFGVGFGMYVGLILLSLGAS